MGYIIRSVDYSPKLDTGWNSPDWRNADIMKLEEIRPESSCHHPETELKMLHDGNCLYGLFRVRDKYVRCICDRFQDSVCQDSCVEIFIKPKVDKGYFNFEFNCGGNLHVSYIEDHIRTEEGLAEKRLLLKEDLAMVRIYHSLPTTIEKEITEDIEWFLYFAIPCRLLEKYIGALGSLNGQQWRMNVYKCADRTSHPHWLSWQPLPEKDFHLPDCFGCVEFQ